MRSLLLLAFLFVACQSPRSKASISQFSGETALEHVENQMVFGPRYPGSDGHTLVQTWLVGQLESLGWNVELQHFEYRGFALTNIIARLDVRSDSEVILIGAHYDTRRFADRDALDTTRPVPGANDGASGVAVLLELARILAQSQSAEVVLVFFDGEDQGRIDDWDWAAGSRYFVDHLDFEVSAAIIVDMVGDQDLNLPYERASDQQLARSIWNTAQGLGYSSFVDGQGPTLIDDHIPFLQNGIPAVDIIDFDYPYWHTSEDRIDKISANSLQQVGSTLVHWLQNMADGEIDFTQ